MNLITSGRYDPPHLGHLQNIKNIFKTNGATTLKVFLLNHPGRRFPVSYCARVLSDALAEYFPSIQVVVNKIHFGEITKEEIGSIDFDIYFGGNLNVLKHLESIGVKTVYAERCYEFNASEYPDPS